MPTPAAASSPNVNAERSRRAASNSANPDAMNGAASTRSSKLRLATLPRVQLSMSASEKGFGARFISSAIIAPGKARETDAHENQRHHRPDADRGGRQQRGRGQRAGDRGNRQRERAHVDQPRSRSRRWRRTSRWPKRRARPARPVDCATGPVTPHSETPSAAPVTKAASARGNRISHTTITSPGEAAPTRAASTRPHPERRRAEQAGRRDGAHTRRPQQPDEHPVVPHGQSRPRAARRTNRDGKKGRNEARKGRRTNGGAQSATVPPLLPHRKRGEAVAKPVSWLAGSRLLSAPSRPQRTVAVVRISYLLTVARAALASHRLPEHLTTNSEGWMITDRGRPSAPRSIRRG